jgi:hypothetical protein
VTRAKATTYNNPNDAPQPVDLDEIAIRVLGFFEKRTTSPARSSPARPKGMDPDIVRTLLTQSREGMRSHLTSRMITDGDLGPVGIAMEAKILRPVLWFGLLEYRNHLQPPADGLPAFGPEAERRPEWLAKRFSISLVPSLVSFSRARLGSGRGNGVTQEGTVPKASLPAVLRETPPYVAPGRGAFPMPATAETECTASARSALSDLAP